MFNGTRVSAAMTTGVIGCEPDTPLAEVAEIMAGHRVHAVYVFDEAHELWGLVSDLDLVAAARGRLDRLTARDASVTPLISVASDDSLDRAAQLLSENGVSHLAVLDPSTLRPVGVLSTLDLARVIASR
jgi:CBS domain-containing protein